MNANLFQAIVDEAAEAIIFADRDGAIRLWNSGAEKVFGHTPAEALGQNLDLIIPERLRAAHWARFNHALTTGKTKYTGRVLTTRAVHKNGAPIYVDLSFGLAKATDGSIAGSFAIGRDCTERYLAEKGLKARVAELEKQLSAPPESS
jgi:PAS domain S-box-containing protein